MDTSSTIHDLYREIEPFSKGVLDLDGNHQMYWEISGNPKGVPIVFLHGGPGAGASASHRRFFDPRHYKIIIFDQRGSGRSTPYADIRNNTTRHLIDDIETLRKYLGIDSWILFGGSWGSSLALAYGIEYPMRVKGYILRGLFLCSESELDWFLNGIRRVFPENWLKFCNFLPEEERKHLLLSYHKRLINPDPTVHEEAACAWGQFEGGCSTLMPNSKNRIYGYQGRVLLALARIEAHYFINNFFLPPNHFHKNIESVRQTPAIIVQGRYDMICPINTAYEYSQLWSEAELIIVPDAGHSAMEVSIRSALIAACERFKKI